MSTGTASTSRESCACNREAEAAPSDLVQGGGFTDCRLQHTPGSTARVLERRSAVHKLDATLHGGATVREWQRQEQRAWHVIPRFARGSANVLRKHVAKLGAAVRKPRGLHGDSVGVWRRHS